MCIGLANKSMEVELENKIEILNIIVYSERESIVMWKGVTHMHMHMHIWLYVQ